MDEMMYGHRLLGRAADSLAYPPTPRLRAPVLAAIATPSPATPRVRTPAAVVLASIAAVVLALALGIALAASPSREAIADFFGIDGSQVEVLPTPLAETPPTPFPTPHDIDANAVPSTLDRAAIAAGFEPALPGNETPLNAYTVRYGDSTAIILRYAEFDLWQIDGAGNFDGIIGKEVPATATITDLMVAGMPGRWISGGRHVVQFVDGQGVEIDSSFRVVKRNTLIWRTEAALYRIETLLPLEEAIVIAESLP
jgi:hypothetical protein